LSANKEKWLLRITKILSEYRDKNNSGMLILVEGKRDKKLLLDLGFNGPIESINRGWNLEKYVVYVLEKYDFQNKNLPLFSILMDWDRTGNILQKKLLQILTSMDKKGDELLRLELIRTLNGRTKTVEGIRFILDDLLELMPITS
tara:strand:+ start:1420 stop:1854 length:435 start_codon:yes stop_codon:yes gene_type:complete